MIRHRGPDTAGECRLDLLGHSLQLGMTRLKIIDLSEIPVPFHFDYLNVTLAYNGEVYNYRDLIPDLSDGGTAWRTHCDAEVLARAWRKWGPRCLEHLNGMFSLILVDEARKEVFIARDRLGKKPLYIYERPGWPLYLASEVKAIPAPLSFVSCEDQEVLEYDVGPSTPVQWVWQLPPGYSIHITQGSQFSDLKQAMKCWWSPPAVGEFKDTSRGAAVDEAEHLVKDAIRIRAVSEVPVGIFLSGGLDSAIIRATVKDVGSYCATFDEIDNLSEAKLADPTVIPVKLTADQLTSSLPNILHFLDTPATWSAFPLYHICLRMAEDGVRVALSGEGADEAFCGYARYAILHWIRQLHEDPRLKHYQETADYLFGSQTDILTRMLTRGSSAAAYRRAPELLRAGTDIVDAMQRTDIATTMQVLLRMADRMSMAHSIETRNPFLDHRLIEFGLRLPPHLRISGVETKPILREVARRLGVHPKIVDQKHKKGLAIPWASWKEKLGLKALHAGHARNGRPDRGSWDRSVFLMWQKEILKALQAEHRPCQSRCHSQSSCQSSRLPAL